MPDQDTRRRRYHLLSQESLERLWDKEGDPEAKGVLEDRRIIEDYATNPQTDFREHQVPLGPRFWILFKKDHLGRVRLWVQMNEATTIEKIKHYAPEVRQWRKFLQEWQGPEQFGRDAFLESLQRRHIEGSSYSDLAEHVTHDALTWLRWYRKQEIEHFEEALKRIDGWSEEETQHWMSECSAALQLFRFVGAKEAYILPWWEAALVHLHSNGEKPITTQLPITRDNIIDTLKAFRKRSKIHKGVEKIG